jgi:hypothetical protein
MVALGTEYRKNGVSSAQRRMVSQNRTAFQALTTLIRYLPHQRIEVELTSE